MRKREFAVVTIEVTLGQHREMKTMRRKKACQKGMLL